MADNPQRELEMILHQSKQLAGRLGSGSESHREITRQHLIQRMQAAQEIYEEVEHPSAKIRDAYDDLRELYKGVGLKNI